DFGIARLPGLPLTPAGAVMGTPGYMAPEQARGEAEVDGRADIFALGCVLFHCLAGRAPFLGRSPMAVLAKLLLEEPPRLRTLGPEVPASFEALIGRMLSKATGERPRDGAALLEQLHRLRLPDEEPRSGRLPALTSGEQRLLCLIFLRMPGEAGA